LGAEVVGGQMAGEGVVHWGGVGLDGLGGGQSWLTFDGCAVGLQYLFESQQHGHASRIASTDDVVAHLKAKRQHCGMHLLRHALNRVSPRLIVQMTEKSDLLVRLFGLLARSARRWPSSQR